MGVIYLTTYQTPIRIKDLEHRLMQEQYGESVAIEALEAIRFKNEVDEVIRVAACAAFVEELMDA